MFICCCCSVACIWLFVTPLTAACQASLSFTITQSLFKIMSIESRMPSNYLIFCCLHLFLPSVFPSIRAFPMSWLFTSGVQSIGVSASVSFQWVFKTDPFRIDWFDLPSVQGTLKSLLQHHNSNPSILPWSAFFMVQLSHPYMTTGKTMAVTIWTLVGKVMSLLFNTLPRFFITFLPRSKHLSISGLQSPSTMILEPKKIRSATASTFSPSICHKVMGQMPWSQFFECWVLSHLFYSHLHQEAH